MAFRIHRGIWQFAKPDGSYESRYKINDSGELVTTDVDGNEQGSLMSTIAEADTLATVTSRGASTTSGLYINNNNPTLYLQDTDNRSAMIHVNSNYFYLLNGSANNSTGWAQQANSRWLFQGNLSNNDITFGGSGDFAGTVTASGGNSSQWNTAYGWGNHATRGYLTSVTAHTHAISDVTGLQSALDGKAASSHSHSYLPLGGGTLTGQLNMHAGPYEGSIVFGSTSTWRTGIRQHDDADAELRIWAKNANGMIFLATGYDGEPANISRPTDGLAIQNNRLGIGNFSSSDPSYKLHVKGDIYANGGWVRVSGSDGLYFESYGGGWHMTDSTWIRSYNSKPIYVDQYVRADQGFEVSGHRVIGNDKNVNAYSKVQIGGFTIQQNAAGDLEFVF